jgi:hypothetical protein
MSSPCNREQYSPERSSHALPAGAPPRGALPSGAMDEWDMLRATPDYDEEEMRGVGLPLYLLPRPDLADGPTRLPQPDWLPLPTPSGSPGHAPELGRGAPEPSVPSPAPREEAPVRWPEAEAVALMATDLYDTSLGDDVSLDVGPFGWLTIRETGHEPIEGWEDDPASASEVWAFLPDEMLGGHDLLGEALQAGERAGLLEENEEHAGRSDAPQGGRRTPTDLLDEALAAGERSGLMDGLA